MTILNCYQIHAFLLYIYYHAKWPILTLIVLYKKNIFYLDTHYPVIMYLIPLQIYRAWHLVVVRISSLTITCIYSNHVCNMFNHWGILMAISQMFQCLYFHPFMPCCYSYSHNAQRDVDNNGVPCPTDMIQI